MTAAAGLRARVRRAVLATGILAATIGGANGCSVLREATVQTTTKEENHELQRKTAQNFRTVWPAIESIRYTQEGSISGSGSWAVNAVLTIAGTEYDEIIGPETRIGDDLPDPESVPASDGLTVHYSDGSTETLR